MGDTLPKFNKGQPNSRIQQKKSAIKLCQLREVGSDGRTHPRYCESRDSKIPSSNRH